MELNLEKIRRDVHELRVLAGDLLRQSNGISTFLLKETYSSTEVDVNEPKSSGILYELKDDVNWIYNILKAQENVLNEIEIKLYPLVSKETPAD